MITFKINLNLRKYNKTFSNTITFKEKSKRDFDPKSFNVFLKTIHNIDPKEANKLIKNYNLKCDLRDRYYKTLVIGDLGEKAVKYIFERNGIPCYQFKGIGDLKTDNFVIEVKTFSTSYRHIIINNKLYNRNLHLPYKVKYYVVLFRKSRKFKTIKETNIFSPDIITYNYDIVFMKNITRLLQYTPKRKKYIYIPHKICFRKPSTKFPFYRAF